MSKSALTLWCLVCVLVSAPPATAQDIAEKGMILMKEENLGGLKVDITAKEFVAILGKPEKTGKDVEWEALGQWVQEYAWPKAGVTANMVSDKKGGSKTVLMFTAKAPWDKPTKKGIRIGSTEEETRKAYGALEEKESSEKGKLLVVGSVYGGMQFHFTKGKVSEIFFGASAE